MRHLVLFTTLGLAGLALPHDVNASPVTEHGYRFLGTVTEAYDNWGHGLFEGIEPGDPLIVDVRIGDGVVDLDPSTSQVHALTTGNLKPGEIWTGIMAGRFGMGTTSEASAELRIGDNESGAGGGLVDRFDLTYSFPFHSERTPLDRHVLKIHLVDHDATTFQGQLPPSLIHPSDFEEASFVWEGYQSAGDTTPIYRLAGHLEAIPEPGSMAVWGGLLAVGTICTRLRASKLKVPRRG
ncbi:hypothetical protein V5E97_35370 [Singulisphaera sp. Ch08]|uniref:PEP-CTERM sorting domain-containing protein n=1 Tax=Singulisphaera sp. Ch08 TaxID=3120278 RepID=A0AAU7CDL9_9BACT